MVAGGNVGLGAAHFVEAGQQLGSQRGQVHGLATDIQLGIGDDVGVGAVVTQRMLVVVALDVVDQAFIQRPGIELTFPVVNNRVAEAENLGLLIGHAGL